MGPKKKSLFASLEEDFDFEELKSNNNLMQGGLAMKWIYNDPVKAKRRQILQNYYFVCTKEGLSFYRNPKEAALGGIVFRGDPFPDFQLQDGEKFSFSVVSTNADGFFLNATSEDEKSEWQQGIGDALKMARNTPLFGVTPLESMKKRDQKGEPLLPSLVTHCIEFIRTLDYTIADVAMKYQGIFRVPAATEEIQEMTRAFELEPDYVIPASTTCHCVASVLKYFFRSMPEPVFTKDLMDRFCAAKQNVQQLRVLFDTQLPRENYILLRYLVFFLSEFTEHSDITQMKTQNLAIVFGMTFSQPANATTEQCMSWSQHTAVLVETMITNCQEIFPEFSLPAVSKPKKPTLVRQSPSRMSDSGNGTVPPPLALGEIMRQSKRTQSDPGNPPVVGELKKSSNTAASAAPASPRNRVMPFSFTVKSKKQLEQKDESSNSKAGDLVKKPSFFKRG